MNRHEQVVIQDMKSTLELLEKTLRAAGNIEFQCYHNDRDRQLAKEFIKMADAAKRSIDFADSSLFFN